MTPPSGGLTTVASTFTVNGGTFSGNAGTVDINGAFTLSSGTFTASSGTTSFAAAFTHSGGTFNHNSGTITFDGATTRVINCGTATFNQVNISAASNNITVNSNCSFNLGNNPTVGTHVILHGTLSGTGTLTTQTFTFRGTPVLSGFTAASMGQITVDASITPDLGSIASLTTTATMTVNGTLTLPATFSGTGLSMGASSTLTASSGTMTFTGGVTLNGTFNHNNGTLALTTGTATITCNSKTLNLVTINITTGTKTIANSCTIPMGSNPTIAGGGGTVTVNGVLSGSGTLTVSSTSSSNALTIGTGGSLSGFTGFSSVGQVNVTGGTLDMSGHTGPTFGGAFSMTSGSFIAPTGTVNFSHNFTVSGGTFTHSSGTVNFNGGSGRTLACGNITFNRVTFENTGSRTIGADCSLPLGSNYTSTGTGAWTVNGTLTGSGTLTKEAGVITLNTGATMTGFTGLTMGNSLVIAGGTLNAGSYTTFDMNGGFTLSSGTFTAPGAGNTATFAQAITISGGTFNHNSGTITIDGANNATITCTGSPFNKVVINHANSNAKTIAAGCEVALGHNPTVAGQTWVSGTLSGTGTLTKENNALVFNDGGLSGFTGLVVADSVSTTINGGTIDLSSYTTVDFNGSFTLAGGTLTMPSGTATFSSGLTISGGTFNHNNGTVEFDGVSGSLSCGGVTFNLVKITNGSSTTRSIASNCSLPLGSNPTVQGRLSVTGTLSGSGTLTVGDNNITFNAGSSLSGFSGFVSNSIVSISGATIDLGAYSTVDLNGSLTINSGTFKAPQGKMTIAKGFTLSGGTFNHNNGTVVFDGSGEWRIVGGPTFYNLTKITTSNDELSFSAESTVTVEGALTLSGSSTNLLRLRSTTNGTQWKINPKGARHIRYVNVRDSNNVNDSVLAIGGTGSVSAGNNTNWNIYTPTVTTLGPTEYVDGSTSTTNQPSFIFTLSDTEASDTILYQLQLDDSADFNSPVVDYTSVLSVQGQKGFTVGQAANNGVYTTGLEGQTLSGGSYYWRVRATDNASNVSAYTTAREGDVAFVIPGISSTGSQTGSANSDTTTSPSTDSTAQATVSLTQISDIQLSDLPATFTFTDTNPRPVFSGKGTEGGTVVVALDGKEVCRAAVQRDGTWKCQADTLGSGTYTLTVQLALNGKTAQITSFTFVVRTRETATPADPVVVTKTTENGSDILPRSNVLAYNAEVKKTSDGNIVVSDFRVVVKDRYGRLLSFVPVTLHSEPQTTKTDAQGIALFKNVPLGKHTLEYVTPAKAKITVPLDVRLQASAQEKVEEGGVVVTELHPAEIQLPVSTLDLIWFILPLLFMLSIIIFGYAEFRRKAQHMLLAGHASPASRSAYEKELRELQQSTATSLPGFTRLHNWLRMHSPAYYWWHIIPGHHILIFVFFVCYLIFTIIYVARHI